jgi:hypothetical protein
MILRKKPLPAREVPHEKFLIDKIISELQIANFITPIWNIFPKMHCVQAASFFSC